MQDLNIRTDRTNNSPNECLNFNNKFNHQQINKNIFKNSTLFYSKSLLSKIKIKLFTLHKIK